MGVCKNILFCLLLFLLHFIYKIVVITGITGYTSHVPPTHYLLEINSFSLLADNPVEKYESEDFEAGGYKWKIVVYPRGNKSKDVKDHISLYLSMSNTSSLSSGLEVYAVFRLFLLDQVNDEFLILQDDMGRERRFHGLKHEWGFDQFISLEDFKDASNGYLVEDKCVFGADVFVKERNICKGERLSKIEYPTSFTHVWKIKNFLKLGATMQESEVFSAGDYEWKIWLYPEGDSRVYGSHLSVFLVLADLPSITPGYKIYVNYEIRILDQVKASNLSKTGKVWFSADNQSWGNPRFVKISKFIDPGSGYLVNDVCVVEANVTLLGISKAL